MANQNETDRELIARLRAMKPAQRSKWFDKASEEQIERVTEECPGDAHSNPYIDHCMVCLYTKWGRSLKRLEPTE